MIHASDDPETSAATGRTRSLKPESYDLLTATSARSALEILRKEVR